MANTLQLKNDIKKLKLGLKSKGLSASIKDKLKTQLTKVENELKSAQAGAPPRKVSTTKSTKDALDSLKQLIKKKGYGVYQNAGVDLKKDAQEGALATGRRVSKGLKGNQYGDKASSKGHVYYEYRANRLDVKQPKGKQKYPKLAEGGYMAKGGETKVAKFKVEDMVYSYQNKDYAAPINYVKFNPWDSNSGTHPNDTYKYRLSLKDGHSNWIDEKSLYKTKQKEYAKGGYMAKGGKLGVKEYKIYPMKPTGVKGMITDDYDNMETFVGTEDEAVARAKEIANSNPNFVRVEVKLRLKTKTNTIGIVDGQNKQYAKGGYMAKGGKLIGKQKNLDVNENGKLDAEDFKMLRKQRMAEGGYMAKGGELTNKYYDVSFTQYGDKKKARMFVNSENDVFSILRGVPKKEIEISSIKEKDGYFKKGYIDYYEDGGMMAEGGVTEKEVVDSNAQMVLSQIKAVKHHADELSQVVSRNSDIEAWVVAKIERASTDLSDITHYLDGQHEKMSMGGSVYHHAHKMDKK